jgi:hypothetical protein
MIYWAEITSKWLVTESVGGEEKRWFATTGAEAVAVDWVSNLLYFTDGFYLKMIGVAKLDGSYAMAIIVGGFTNPVSIAVDPEEGLVS